MTVLDPGVEKSKEPSLDESEVPNIQHRPRSNAHQFITMTPENGRGFGKDISLFHVLLETLIVVSLCYPLAIDHIFSCT